MAEPQLKDSTSFYPASYRDCWPRPLSPLSTGFELQEVARIYKSGVEVFLDSDFLPNYPLTESTFQILDQFLPQLLEEGRWKNYQVLEIGDMNVGTHTLRQAGITAQALYWDVKELGLTYLERDSMVAAGLLHDLGELATGDITYELKRRGNKRDFDLAEAEAVMNMIDDLEGSMQDKAQLKEVYLRITTSLEDADINSLMETSSSLEEEVNWPLLRKLFTLYERYGFLITAVEQWPFPISGRVNLSAKDLESVKKWNRAELEEALDRGEEVSGDVRAAVLMKNVLLNQWPHLVQAANEGIPSVGIFFRNNLAVPVIIKANELMVLNLDTSLLA